MTANPLVSLLAPANHHDRHFLPLLVNLAQAMGIDLQLITADEAYHDKDGSLVADTGVILTSINAMRQRGNACFPASVLNIDCYR